MLDAYIRQYGRRLYGLCLTLCGSVQEAEDLYQDTWLKALRYFSRYDHQMPFEPWLTKICVNTYRNRLWRLARSPFLTFSTAEGWRMRSPPSRRRNGRAMPRSMLPSIACRSGFG